MKKYELVYKESATIKVLSKLNKLPPGSIFTIEELRNLNGVTYSAIRSVVIRLHQQNLIHRICRGIYYLPILGTKGSEFPSVEKILDSLSQKENFRYCPIGKYAEYILGLSHALPEEIICYTTGRVKTLNLETGIQIKLVSCKKKSFQSAINIKSLIVRQYLHDIGPQGLTKEAKQIINKYMDYHDLNVGGISI